MPEIVAPGAPYTSRIVGLSTGLVGTVRFRLVDDDAVVDDPVYGPSAASIIEDPTGSGSYLFRGTAPTTRTKYARLWDTGVGTALIPDDDLIVAYDQPPALQPPGAIYDYLKLQLPITVDALAGITMFGQAGLQAQIDLVKLGLFATVVASSLEATVYSPPVRDYVAKLAAIRIIPPAIDYWGDQTTSVSTSGTNESASYPDRREGLWKIYERLRRELRRKRIVFEGGLWLVRRSTHQPGVPTVRGPASITPNPASFPPLMVTEVGTLPWRISD